MPSKQTATQLNRQAADTPVHYWRKPGKVKSGNVYGNLIHRVMEYLDYKNCGDMDSIRAQVDALVTRGLLSREEADAADVSQLAAFFDSAIGKTLRNHPNVLREFQFSILDDPDDPALAGEKVLLQGVVDCAMVDNDGIVILDFKTDQVSENDVEDKMSLYRPQISTYAKALSRIYGKPVKAAYLYFFRLNRTISVI
jgi:ATP-dependent helicase/nuclease subunit A